MTPTPIPAPWVHPLDAALETVGGVYEQVCHLCDQAADADNDQLSILADQLRQDVVRAGNRLAQLRAVP